ncbi:MAG: GIY-YIG nuclease family protein [Candidatus Andersenbacteria bacterium]|nr:GIY-YIG nuclease family protein [Candidatus Andersenbacteria bacterium]
MVYVYFLKLNNGKTYIGSTQDLRRRLREHQGGKVPSTRGRTPVRLIYYEAYSNEKDARNREKYLKTGDGKRSLQKQMPHTLNMHS